MQMVHANLCVNIDNIAVVLLSVMVLRLFIVAKRNSRLQSQGFEEQNDSSQLANINETAWLLRKLWALF